MSIAGYDPSGGAGVLADVKVFEQHKTYGFAVITSNTLQDDEDVKAIKWIPVEDIKKQIDVILNKFQVTVFKIGIVENGSMLMTIKDHILTRIPNPKIIWDPILIASSGFKIFDNKNSTLELLDGIYCVTPNLPEFIELIRSEEEAFRISKTTSIYLKGGHNLANKGLDELFLNEERISLKPETTELSSKHGSGCILSSSLAANIALGFNLQDSCKNAKSYTEKTLLSNKTLLAYHN
ncbi:MAG TPA: hydroxymethylpyrimidine/phosphomethylpyrimidine kinase [Bacteroidia bacterium]|nr:hydroxymethylpyrimidine/phosphomethylpyrimidine kinase [Bacteroidia bacterium]